MNTDAGGVSAISDWLGPPLDKADMVALAAVAHQAGLTGIDLRALALVLDAARRVTVAAERERLVARIAEYTSDLESQGCNEPGLRGLILVLKVEHAA